MGRCRQQLRSSVISSSEADKKHASAGYVVAARAAEYINVALVYVQPMPCFKRGHEIIGFGSRSRSQCVQHRLVGWQAGSIEMSRIVTHSGHFPAGCRCAQGSQDNLKFSPG